MSVPHPGDEPNVRLYEHLKREVLDRVPQITAIEYVPDRVTAMQLRAEFDPFRLEPPSGPEPPLLTVKWYRQTPHDWFRVDYSAPNTGSHAGWHQDADHPELGRCYIQYSTVNEVERRNTTFDHETPSLVLWELLEEVHPAHVE